MHLGRVDRRNWPVLINIPQRLMPKRMIEGEIVSKGRKEKPTMRWLDDVESDLKRTKVKGWKEKIRDREQWGLAVKEAKAHPGL
jgi:hypothetical protein